MHRLSLGHCLLKALRDSEQYISNARHESEDPRTQ